MTSLRSLQMWTNSLTGTIPVGLSTMTSMDTLGLHENSLTGAIPAELSTMTSMEALYLFENSLTGAVPSYFCDAAPSTCYLVYRTAAAVSNQLWCTSVCGSETEEHASCVDDDDTARAVSGGYDCQALAAYGYCAQYFCPNCGLSGVCDASCGYCTVASGPCDFTVWNCIPEPTSAPTISLPPTPIPSPIPTPNPSRTPMVVLTIILSGISCDDYEQSVFFSACDDFLSYASFDDSTCSDDGGRRRAAAEYSMTTDDGRVQFKSQRRRLTSSVSISMPLTMPKTYETDDCSILCLVSTIMTAKVSTGEFTNAIQTYAASRRLQARRLEDGGMAGANAESVSVDTSAPSPAPSPLPSLVPTPSPTPSPTASPTPSPTLIPTADPTGSPTAAPTPVPTPEPTPKPTPRPTGWGNSIARNTKPCQSCDPAAEEPYKCAYRCVHHVASGRKCCQDAPVDEL